MKKLGMYALATLLAASACGAPVIRHEAGLRVSAQDALREARLQAVSWDPGAVLRYVEGRNLSPDGYAVAGTEGAWSFVYDAAGRNEQFLVTVSQAGEEHRTRAAQSPTGIVLGSNARVADGWIDSPRALEALRASLPADTPLSMLLVPTAPQQWIVRAADRQWRVNAATGAVIQ